MGKAWNLGDGETIHDCIAPTDNPWQMPVCAECGQIAYQIVIVAEVGGNKRRVPLLRQAFYQRMPSAARIE